MRAKKENGYQKAPAIVNLASADVMLHGPISSLSSNVVGIRELWESEIGGA